jgi:hypothetical protein
VWSLPEVRGYNQLIDASDMAMSTFRFRPPTPCASFSSLAASMDDPELKSRALPSLATSAFAYGTRAHVRHLPGARYPRSTRVVSVFRSVDDAPEVARIGRARRGEIDELIATTPK